MIIRHTEEFDLAYRFATETTRNIFLTGKAGTGKTTFLKYLRENSFKNMVVTAPTGVAAINAGGMTLHSLFQLPFKPFIPSKDLQGNIRPTDPHYFSMKLRGQKLGLLRNLELLVIDEVSMVAANTLDAVDMLLRSVRKMRDRPFGGVQVLFIGDLHQLQPVVRNEEWEMLRNYYPSIFFFDSLVLRESPPVKIELKEIFRQKDERFIEALNQIRDNDLTEGNLNLLNSRLKPGWNQSGKEEGYITLTTHNAQADEINRKELNRLSGKPKIFKAEIEGEFPENQFPAETELVLKTGAQVMFLKNDNEGKLYFNGKIGVVTGFESDKILVRCKDEESEIPVTGKEWPNITYTLDPETKLIAEKQIGSFHQYPLRLAWAITIHKSQGLTFEKVMIDAEKAFVNGQVYVALSRCTSLEGLILTSPLNRRFLGATDPLKLWLEKHSDDRTLMEKFHHSKREFESFLIREIFSFEKLGGGLAALRDILQRHDSVLDPSWLDAMSNLREKMKSLIEVASRFQVQIVQLIRPDQTLEENLLLQERIKAAAVYFHPAISNWNEDFRNLPIAVKTKTAGVVIGEILEDLISLLHDHLHRLGFCKDGFSILEYLKTGKFPSHAPSPYRKIYAGEAKRKYGSLPGEHPELYRRLVALRHKIAEAERIPVFMVFTNKAMELVCDQLPRNRDALLRVKGIGHSKAKKFGLEVVEVVIRYCGETGAHPLIAEKGKVEKAISKQELKVSSSILESANLLKSGKTIPQIAAERNLVPGTIESHLAKAISLGLIAIADVMSAYEFEKISAEFPGSGKTFSVTEIKNKLPEEFTYGMIRMAVAWNERMQKDEN